MWDRKVVSRSRDSLIVVVTMPQDKDLFEVSDLIGSWL